MLGVRHSWIWFARAMACLITCRCEIRNSMDNSMIFGRKCETLRRDRHLVHHSEFFIEHRSSEGGSDENKSSFFCELKKK